jgi:tetratricopeptide (TPR) repeat protein/TolB-like protein
MSPEQALGKAVDFRSDQFAVGLMLYEMLAGRPAFERDTPLQTLLAIAQDDPPALDKARPDMPEHVPRIVARCLAKSAEERYASTRELAADLEALLDGAPSATRAGRRRTTAIAMAATVALALYGLSRFATSPPVSSPSPSMGEPAASGRTAPQRARRSAAILGFRNLSPRHEAGWLSTALSELLTAEISASETLRTIPGENVSRMKQDLALAETDTLAKDTLARVREVIGSDLVVLGSYLVVGAPSTGQIRVDVRVQETATGETIATLAEIGGEAELLDLVSRAGEQLRRKLSVGDLPSSKSAERTALLAQTSPEALRLYWEGLARLRTFDATGARDLLVKAIRADEEFPLAHSALAEAWSVMGYDPRAIAEAKRAFELSSSAPQEELLLIEGRYREMERDWNRAVEIYRTLWERFPDDGDQGLRLVGALLSVRRGAEATEVLRALRQLPPPMGRDPRIDLADARVAGALSDLNRQRDAAARGAERGRELGARLLVADALLVQSNAVERLGDPKQAKALALEAQQLGEAVGSQRVVASAMVRRGILLTKEGDRAGGRRLWEMALAVYSEIGNQSALATVTMNLANALADDGQLDEAIRRYQQVLAVAREIGARRIQSATLSNLGVALMWRGDYLLAQPRLAEAVAINTEIADRDGEATALGNLAWVSRIRGELREAQRLAEQSLDIRRALGVRSGVATALADLSMIRASAGELAAARKLLEESLSVRTELGEQTKVLETQLSLAALSIDEGRPLEAEAPAMAIAERLRTPEHFELEAEARAVVARSLVYQGRHTEARAPIERALALSSKSRNVGLKLSVRLDAAHVRAASDPNIAIRDVEAILSEARRLGHLPHQMQARLLWGELDMAAGHVAAGRQRLRELAADARRAGFELAARKAETSERTFR